MDSADCSADRFADRFAELETQPVAGRSDTSPAAGLRRLIGTLLAEQHPFWAPRLEAVGLGLSDSSHDGSYRVHDVLARVPPITKRELVAEQERSPPYGRLMAPPLERYTRLHQTSGTSGRPLVWLDDPEGWNFVRGNWMRVLEACDIGPGDRVLVAFSFGPFLGFWGAFEAASAAGCMALPGGGIGSQGRLDLLRRYRANVVCCTPTYALRLAEVAAADSAGTESQKLALPEGGKILVAGEPGGSLPAVRERISRAWGGAEVLDHHGMTEVGPVTYPSRTRPGTLHVIESSYLAEVLDPTTLEPVDWGEVGELVLTTLGRTASPLLRYRTGDLVRPVPPADGNRDLALDGGILARADDMVVVRGVNLYPSAIDRVVRTFDEIAEYRVWIDQRSALTELEIEIEPVTRGSVPTAELETLTGRVESALRSAFSLRLPVRVARPGSLPRFELKAKRWVERSAAPTERS